MKTFLNILWHIPFLGFIVALGIAITGGLFCITIIGIPIGLGLFQFSLFLLWPHGYAMVSKSDLGIITEKKENTVWLIFTIIARILYFPLGIFFAIIMTIYAFMQFISLIGIPCGLVMMKSIGTYFNPVNKVRVPEIVAQEIERRKNENMLGKYELKKDSPTPISASQPVNEKVIVKVICPNCDARIDEQMSFCPYCGTSLQKKSKPVPTVVYPPSEQAETTFSIPNAPLDDNSKPSVSVTTENNNDNLRFAPPEYRKE